MCNTHVYVYMCMSHGYRQPTLICQFKFLGATQNSLFVDHRTSDSKNGGYLLSKIVKDIKKIPETLDPNWWVVYGLVCFRTKATKYAEQTRLIFCYF